MARKIKQTTETKKMIAGAHLLRKHGMLTAVEYAQIMTLLHTKARVRYH